MNVDLVEVPFRLRSSKKVTANDVAIRENGVRQTILDLRSERAPASFVFVVDRSLSMGDGKLEAALRAIDSMRSRLTAEDRASVIFFNHRVGLRRTLARGTSLADEAPPPTSGGTSIRDALAAVGTDKRTIVLAISDGSDRNSTIDEAELLNRMSRADLTVYAVLVGDGSAEKVLSTLADRTGGALLRADRSSIGSALRSVLADINSRFVATYQSSTVRRGWRSIEVTSKAGSISGSRKGYFAQ
jgi:tight adherence protein B